MLEEPAPPSLGKLPGAADLGADKLNAVDDQVVALHCGDDSVAQREQGTCDGRGVQRCVGEGRVANLGRVSLPPEIATKRFRASH